MKELTGWNMLTAYRKPCSDLSFARMRFSGNLSCSRQGHPSIRHCSLLESGSSGTTTAPISIKFTYGHSEDQGRTLMTIMDFTTAIDAYRKLRGSGLSLEIVVKQLFESDIGRIELIKAVETVERLSPAESRKIVTKVLAN